MMARHGARYGAVWGVPYLLLVVLISFGVVAMHTSCHPAPTGHSHVMVAIADDSAAVDPACMAIQVEDTTQVGTPAVGCESDDCCSMAVCSMAVCLAVLTAATPQHAVRWLPVSHGLSPAVEEWLEHAWRAGSDPPPRPVRLRLADLSVLRR
jgi:CO/xanthine dehydrogenase Mo-binding subunit